MLINFMFFFNIGRSLENNHHSRYFYALRPTDFIFNILKIILYVTNKKYIESLYIIYFFILESYNDKKKSLCWLFIVLVRCFFRIVLRTI